MKRILIGDTREELLSTLEVILKNWGYRTLCTSDASEFISLLGELSPSLLLAGPGIISKKEVVKQIEAQKAPFLFIEEEGSKPPAKGVATEVLAFPIDVFKLFEFAQKHLEKVPRRNIRLKVQLPSIYYHGDAPCIAEIASISSEGIFIRTGSRIEGIDQVRLVLPLIGMQTEVELEGRVVYRVEPQMENNYIQGMGIEFQNVDAETARKLQRFVESLLVAELSEKSFIKNSLQLNQLQQHTDDALLRIQPTS